MEHLRRSSRELCSCSTMSFITDRRLSLEMRKVRHLTHFCGCWPLLTTGTAIVILSVELRSAYTRPLVLPQQRLLFNIMALLSYKGFFSTSLQGWLSPNKFSFFSSSGQCQQVLQEERIKKCLSYNAPVKAFHDCLAFWGMPTTELHWRAVEGPSRVPGPLADQGVDRTFYWPCTGCIVLSTHWWSGRRSPSWKTNMII